MVANSSSSMHQSLCHASQSSTLLEFKQSFLLDEDASVDPSVYPKVAKWHAPRRSCLYGTINSSNSQLHY
ncbi:hypothetical protein CK203_025624 [Vitis vinifera]|uniref:Uncharacterized protein n=1 Tax=Vitis vinifera TaxID=29760 RepID=A0A438IET5_VITVI|nr:hypothetical protein CK203_025624 [Vitis vinifera]